MSEEPAPPPAAVIEVPDPSLVLLVGVAGSGKSTFAARHFAAGEVLSSDAFRELVAGDPDDQSATGDAFQVLHTVLDKRLRRRLFTVVDATNLVRDDRRRLLRIAADHDVPLAAIVLDLPLEVCQRRDAERSDRTVGTTVLRQHDRLLRRGLEQLTGDPAYAVIRILTSEQEVAGATIVRRPGSA